MSSIFTILAYSKIIFISSSEERQNLPLALLGLLTPRYHSSQASECQRAWMRSAEKTESLLVSLCSVGSLFHLCLPCMCDVFFCKGSLLGALHWPSTFPIHPEVPVCLKSCLFKISVFIPCVTGENPLENYIRPRELTASLRASSVPSPQHVPTFQGDSCCFPVFRVHPSPHQRLLDFWKTEEASAFICTSFYSPWGHELSL